MKTIAKSLLADGWHAVRGGRGAFRSLRENTALTFPGQIPKHICEVLIARIDDLADEPGRDDVWRDPEEADTRILAFERHMPEFLSYLRIGERVAAIDAYLGLETRSWFLMANRVVPKPGNLGSGAGLHRDSAFSHQVKCIWYLGDVGTGNGPFRYVPGSHRTAFADRGKYPLGERRIPAALDPMEEVTAEAGTLLVADTKCIHGGKPAESGPRYALTLYTYRSLGKCRSVFRELGVNPDYARVV